MSVKHNVYNLGGGYESISKDNTIEEFTPSQKLVEGFSLSIGNKYRSTDSTLVKEVDENKKDINNSSVISGTANLLSSAINSVISENRSKFNALLNASNNFEIDNAKVSGAIVVSGVTQTATVEQEATQKTTQEIKSEIINDISASIKSKIDETVKTAEKEQDISATSTNTATDLGGTLASVAQTLGDTAAQILSASIGNSTSKSTDNTAESQLIKSLNLDNSFTLSKDNTVSNTLSNVLEPKNIKEAISETKTGANFGIKNVEGTSLEVTDIKQVAVINSVMNNILNQSVMASISSKVVQNLDDDVNRMIDSAWDKVKDSTQKSTTGDIYAAGVAGKQILEGVGTAAVGVGEGVNTAAVGVGEGVSTGAQGVGKGLASAFSGFALPLIAGGIILVIAFAIYLYGKKQGWFDDSDIASAAASVA